MLTPLHLSDAALPQPASDIIRVLAQSAQQEGTEARLHRAPNREPLALTSIELSDLHDVQNQYPTIGNAFTAVWQLLTVWLSDGPLRGRRWPTSIFSSIVGMIIATLLVVTPLYGPFSHRAPLYIMAAIGGTSVSEIHTRPRHTTRTWITRYP